eukprot:8506950-Karenia_brevis.AAC.1
MGWHYRKLSTIETPMKKRGPYHWYFCSGIPNGVIDKVNTLRSQNKRIPQDVLNKSKEHRGVAFVLHE